MGEKSANKRGRYISWIVIISLIYIIFLEIVVKPKIMAVGGRFVTPVETTYYDGIETDFVLLKDETPFNASSVNGAIRYDEGTRLGFGEIKAGKTTSNEYALLSKKLQDINDRISIYKNQINDIDKELRRSIINENYSLAVDLVGSFSYQNNESVGQINVEDLEKEKANITNQINHMAGEIIWNPPGIISYTLDGFEDLNNESLYLTSREEFKSILNRPIVKSYSRDFKIIDNFKATAMFYAPNNGRLKELDGKYVTYSIDNLNTFGKGIAIVPADYDKEGVAGIFINSHIEDIYQIRKGKINVIFDSLKALIVPTGSLIKKDGVVGVLARDVNGVIQFRPVNLLKREAEKSYVSQGNKKGMIKVKGEDVMTLQYYEDVVVRPDPDLIGEIFIRNEFR